MTKYLSHLNLICELGKSKRFGNSGRSALMMLRDRHGRRSIVQQKVCL